MTDFQYAAWTMLLASLVAGCDGVSLPGGSSAADKASEIRAGRWQMTATTRSFDLPGASVSQAQRYRAAIGQSQTQNHCLSAAEARLGPMAMAEGFKQGDCSVAHFDAAKGQIHGQLACQIAGGGSADIQIGGSYTANSIVMVLNNELRQPSLPGGKAHMIMEVTGTRLGDCPA